MLFSGTVNAVMACSTKIDVATKLSFCCCNCWWQDFAELTSIRSATVSQLCCSQIAMY